MLCAWSSQYPHRLQTSLFLFQLANPLLQELPPWSLLGQRQSSLVRGARLSCPGFLIFLPKARSCTCFLENQMVGKANLLLQGNEFKEQRALASNGYETRIVGFESGALWIFREE
jgi:hypothetical protein